MSDTASDAGPWTRATNFFLVSLPEDAQSMAPLMERLQEEHEALPEVHAKTAGWFEHIRQRLNDPDSAGLNALVFFVWDATQQTYLPMMTRTFAPNSLDELPEILGNCVSVAFECETGGVVLRTFENFNPVMALAVEAMLELNWLRTCLWSKGVDPASVTPTSNSSDAAPPTIARTSGLATERSPERAVQASMGKPSISAEDLYRECGL